MLATRTLAWMHEELGDIDRYRELTEANLGRARAVGSKRIEARAQATLAGFAVKEGRVAEGLAMCQSSLRLDLEVGDRQGARLDLYDIAEALSVGGGLERAALVLAAVERWREEAGYAREPWVETMNEGTLRRIRAGLGDAAMAEALARGAALPVEEAVALALGAELPPARATLRDDAR